MGPLRPLAMFREPSLSVYRRSCVRSTCTGRIAAPARMFTPKKIARISTSAAIAPNRFINRFPFAVSRLSLLHLDHHRRADQEADDQAQEEDQVARRHHAAA